MDVCKSKKELLEKLGIPSMTEIEKRLRCIEISLFVIPWLSTESRQNPNILIYLKAISNRE